MMGTMSLRQPENWLYEVWQKGYDSPCYVMVPNAKDLVKSHLMIAVREEVEVLKEKISELMDKINQLEVENTILKANMSQETLQQLQMQTQLQIAGSNGNTPAIAAPPTANTAAIVQANGVPTAPTTNSAGTGAATAASTPTGGNTTNVNSTVGENLANTVGNNATVISENENGGGVAVPVTVAAVAATTNGPMS